MATKLVRDLKPGDVFRSGQLAMKVVKTEIHPRKPALLLVSVTLPSDTGINAKGTLTLKHLQEVEVADDR
jgi:hypothetical protein